METSVHGVGRCKFAFWFAVFHDIFGLLILLSGVFWNVFFHDFLVYAGSVIIFLSLIWWVFWYTGNIEVPPAELEDDITLYKRNNGISRVVRKVSNRLSNGLRNSFRKSGRSNGQVGNSGPNGTNGPTPAEQPSIAMVSYINVRPTGASNNLNREPLSV